MKGGFEIYLLKRIPWQITYSTFVFFKGWESVPTHCCNHEGCRFESQSRKNKRDSLHLIADPSSTEMHPYRRRLSEMMFLWPTVLVHSCSCSISPFWGFFPSWIYQGPHSFALILILSPLSSLLCPLSFSLSHRTKGETSLSTSISLCRHNISKKQLPRHWLITIDPHLKALGLP